jgi:5'-nucleotidase
MQSPFGSDEVVVPGPEGKVPDLHILHFNDVYDLNPRPKPEPVGGAARFATAVKSFAHYNPLLLFSGDVFNPSLLSTITKGKHMVPVLNYLQVQCAIYGNHDFDFGVDLLSKYASQCNFPWLLSNVNQGTTHGPLAGGLKSEIIEWNGVKIGLIGLVEEEWLVTIPGLPPVQYLDFVDEGRRLASELKEQHGVRFVIALTHMRQPNDEKLAKSVEEIDLVLGGHDHFYAVSKPDGVNTWVVKSGTEFRNLSLIKVFLPPQGEKGIKVSIERVDVTERFEPDPGMQAIISEFSAQVDAKLQKTIGWAGVVLDARTSTVRTMESNISNWIMDIVRSETGADVALANSGTIRSDTTYGPGNFTLKDLLNILPFPDPMVVLEVTGRQLKEALENGLSKVPVQEGRFPAISGIRVVYNPNLEPGNRILWVGIGAREGETKELEMDGKYQLATKSYLAQGHDGYDVLAQAKVLVDEENARLLPALVRNYLTKLSVLHGFRRVRVAELVRNAFKPVRLRPWGRGGLTDSNPLATIAPTVDGRITVAHALTWSPPPPVGVVDVGSSSEGKGKGKEIKQDEDETELRTNQKKKKMKVEKPSTPQEEAEQAKLKVAAEVTTDTLMDQVAAEFKEASREDLLGEIVRLRRLNESLRTQIQAEEEALQQLHKLHGGEIANSY